MFSLSSNNMATLAQQKVNKLEQGFRQTVSCYMCKHFDMQYAQKCKLGGFKVKNYSTATCDKVESRF